MFEQNNHLSVVWAEWAREVVVGGRLQGRRHLGLNYISRRNMIKYSNKGSPIFQDKQDSSPNPNPREKPPSSKPPPSNSFKTNILDLSRITQNENQQDGALTPRSKAYQGPQVQTDPNSKSISTTPTKQRLRKEHSFILTFNKHEPAKLSPLPTNAMRETWTDRSQRILKTRALNNEASTRRMDEMAKLRQTVSNATSWQYRVTPTPLPFPNTPRAPVDQRKKNEADCSEGGKKDLKSKFVSKQHSRNNSRTQDFVFQPTLIERPPASKTPIKTTTPRGSYNELTSGTIVKDRSMSKTDPLGSFTSLTLIKKSTSTRPSELKIQDFNLGVCKGEGRFGKVFPAVHKRTGFLLAIKQVAKESVRLMLDQFLQEVKISLYLNHPNIVRVYGCFSDKDSVFIMMEYMEEGSLFRLVKMARRFTQEETATKLAEICEAVRYLHARDILHRDIKPENIVLSNGVCKLCDFGWAAYSKQRRTTYCGTLDYVCPQILQGESYDNFVDIWAIGVLAYQMLVGKAPFYHISRKETMKSIMKCDFTLPSDISVAAKLFIKKALQKKPDLRFTVQSLLRDRFLMGQTST